MGKIEMSTRHIHKKGQRCPVAGCGKSGGGSAASGGNEASAYAMNTGFGGGASGGALTLGAFNNERGGNMEEAPSDPLAGSNPYAFLAGGPLGGGGGGGSSAAPSAFAPRPDDPRACNTYLMLKIVTSTGHEAFIDGGQVKPIIQEHLRLTESRCLSADSIWKSQYENNWPAIIAYLRDPANKRRIHRYYTAFLGPPVLPPYVYSSPTEFPSRLDELDTDVPEIPLPPWIRRLGENSRTRKNRKNRRRSKKNRNIK
jgi:hypothetical protein